MISSEEMYREIENNGNHEKKMPVLTIATAEPVVDIQCRWRCDEPDDRLRSLGGKRDWRLTDAADNEPLSPNPDGRTDAAASREVAALQE